MSIAQGAAGARHKSETAGGKRRSAGAPSPTGSRDLGSRRRGTGILPALPGFGPVPAPRLPAAQLSLMCRAQGAAALARVYMLCPYYCRLSSSVVELTT